MARPPKYKTEEERQAAWKAMRVARRRKAGMREIQKPVTSEREMWARLEGCKNIRDAEKKACGALKYARKHGLYPAVKAKLSDKQDFFTFEHLVKVCAPLKFKSDLKKLDKALYNWAIHPNNAVDGVRAIDRAKDWKKLTT